MYLGDFEPEEIIKEIEKRSKENKPNSIKRIYPNEPKEPVGVSIETKMEVSIPLFVIGIKDFSSQKNIITKHTAIEIILNLLIGKSSKLYKKLYESEAIISEPSLEYEFGESYAHIVIGGGSKKPKKVLDELKKEIQKLKEKGISNSDFTRTRNMIYGDTVREYNNISDVCRMFMSDYFKGINSFDYIEEIDNISIETVQEVLNEVFDEKNMVISVVKNK